MPNSLLSRPQRFARSRAHRPRPSWRWRSEAANAPRFSTRTPPPFHQLPCAMPAPTTLNKHNGDRCHSVQNRSGFCCLTRFIKVSQEKYDEQRIHLKSEATATPPSLNVMSNISRKEQRARSVEIQEPGFIFGSQKDT